MKRKIISALLALVLCFSLAVNVSAETGNIDFVVDEIGYLEESELSLLNKQAAAIYDERGVGIFFVYTTDKRLEHYAVDQLVGGMENYYVMIENDTSWYSFSGGIAQEYIDSDTEEDLRAVYDEADTYVGGVGDFLDAAAEYFPRTEENTDEVFVYDDADLLSDKEEEDLSAKLCDISQTHEAQIVVVTVESLDGEDIDDYVEYVYDEMEFGYSSKHDGVLLLVSMDPREYRILSNGFAGAAIEDAELDAISEAIESDLSDGNYADAFDEFADQCDYYLDGYLNGFPFDLGKNLMIALVIGIAAGLIVAFALKGQLKSVRKQNQANVYVKQGSMQVTLSNDMFLYRNVTRTKKESSKSSDSGSSRNVGGGSF